MIHYGYKPISFYNYSCIDYEEIIMHISANASRFMQIYVSSFFFIQIMHA